MIIKENGRTLVSLIAYSLLLGSLAFFGAGCDCAPDPDDIDVGPNCPGGTNAASSITIQYDLSGIRDVGTDKQVQISANRDSGQHNCFAPDAEGSLSPPTELTGQGSGTETIPNLRDGNWTISVQVVAGTLEPHPEVVRTGLLSPGASRTLVITSDASGGLSVTF